MYGVPLCVILAIATTASGFVLRTRRDLQQTIHDIYGPPNTMLHPHHPPPLRPSHDDIREPGEQIPQGILDKVFGPQFKAGSRDIESQRPHFHSAINVDARPYKEKDLPKEHRNPGSEFDEAAFVRHEIANIFGTSPPEPVNENRTVPTNISKVPLDYEDRFLSESLLREQLLGNVRRIDEEEAKNSRTKDNHPPELLRGSISSEVSFLSHKHEPSLPESVPSDKPSFLEDKVEPTIRNSDFSKDKDLKSTHLYTKPTEPDHLEPRTPFTKNLNNASIKNGANVSLMIFVYFCIKSLVLI